MNDLPPTFKDGLQFDSYFHQRLLAIESFCKKYFLIKCNANNDILKNTVLNITSFKTCQSINLFLEAGERKEVLLFEKFT